MQKSAGSRGDIIPSTVGLSGTPIHMEVGFRLEIHFVGTNMHTKVRVL